MRNKKGQGFIWLWVLISIFIISLIYLAITPAFEKLWDISYPLIEGAEAQQTASKVRTVWWVWPVILLVGSIIAGLVQTLRQDPNYPMYP